MNTSNTTTSHPCLKRSRSEGDIDNGRRTSARIEIEREVRLGVHDTVTLGSQKDALEGTKGDVLAGKLPPKVHEYLEYIPIQIATEIWPYPPGASSLPGIPTRSDYCTFYLIFGIYPGTFSQWRKSEKLLNTYRITEVLNLRSSLAINFAMDTFAEHFRQWLECVTAACETIDNAEHKEGDNSEANQLVQAVRAAHKKDMEAAQDWWGNPTQLNSDWLRPKRNPLLHMDIAEQNRVKAEIMNQVPTSPA